LDSGKGTFPNCLISNPCVARTSLALDLKWVYTFPTIPLSVWCVNRGGTRRFGGGSNRQPLPGYDHRGWNGSLGSPTPKPHGLPTFETPRDLRWGGSKQAGEGKIVTSMVHSKPTLFISV